MLAVFSTSGAVVVVSYVLILTFVALRARAASNFVEFSVAKRALPVVFIFGSLAATYVGPGFSMGFVGKGFSSGYIFFFLGLMFAVQNIVVGLFVAPRLRSLENCHTLGDVFGVKYNKAAQIIAGVISVGLCGLSCAIMVKAGGIVLNEVLGIPLVWSVIAIAAVTALYTAFGGLRASVITDALQFAMFAILLPAALIWILMVRPEVREAGLAKEAFEATTAGFGAISKTEMFGLIIAFLFGETLFPTFASRAFASRTIQTSRTAFILSGSFSMVWFFVMIMLGVAARNIVPAGIAEDQILLTLIKMTLPGWGYALLVVTLVSVIMSTLDSNMNAGAICLTEDIARPLVRITDSSALSIGRWTTVIIAAVGAASALAIPTIIKGLLICYSIWAPAILPALIAGLWIKEPRPIAGVSSLIVGSVVAIVFQAVLTDSTGIPAILPALAASIIVYIIGHVFGKRRPGA